MARVPCRPSGKQMNRSLACALTALIAVPTGALAGPPFLTDDPEPVDYQHSEFYAFGTYDKTPDGSSTALPAFEYNYGVFPEIQLHLIIPFTTVSATGAPTQSGLGDTEIGVKYRFVDETDDRPQIGIFPMVEAPTGNAARGLGNGQVWYRLPLWIQKSWGSWTSYGGVGYAINHATGMQNSWFSGWLLQRDLSETITLGGELFRQQADTQGGEGTTLVNLGGYYNMTGCGCSLLFSGGHSIAGESQKIAYLGLYWTWGHK